MNVSPRTARLILAGDTVRLSAEVRDKSGNSMPDVVVNWLSSDAQVATVTATGLVTAVSDGTATVAAEAGDVRGTAGITVEVDVDRAALIALYEATDGRNWTNNQGWLSDAPLGQWHGVYTDASGRVSHLVLGLEWDEDLNERVPLGLTGRIPPEIGNLDRLQVLSLTHNRLTGPIPSEIASPSGLRWLDLSDNALEGPVPPEIAGLPALRGLHLGGNDLEGPVPPEFGGLEDPWALVFEDNPGMEGGLPGELTALDGLDVFLAGDTDLCAPPDSVFRSWLEGIPRRRVKPCADAPATYLVQAVQLREYAVPLVAGDSALLRVFVTARKATTEGIPDVRARFHLDDEEDRVVLIPGKSTPIPTTIDESSLDKSANAVIPGGTVQPGLEQRRLHPAAPDPGHPDPGGRTGPLQGDDGSARHRRPRRCVSSRPVELLGSHRVRPGARTGPQHEPAPRPVRRSPGRRHLLSPPRRLAGHPFAGNELFALSFDMPEVADGGGATGFAFVLAAEPGWAGNLARITLSGPGGSVRLDLDTDLGLAIVRDPRSGQVRAILRDGAESEEAQAEEVVKPT